MKTAWNSNQFVVYDLCIDTYINMAFSDSEIYPTFIDGANQVLFSTQGDEMHVFDLLTGGLTAVFSPSIPTLLGGAMSIGCQPCTPCSNAALTVSTATPYTLVVDQACGTLKILDAATGEELGTVDLK